MRGALLLGAAFALAYVGHALLALTLAANWRRVTGTEQPARVAAPRAAGYTLLALALVPLLACDRPSFASTLWVLLLGAAAAAVACTLAWRARWLRPLARGLAASTAALPSPPAASG